MPVFLSKTAKPTFVITPKIYGFLPSATLILAFSSVVMFSATVPLTKYAIQDFSPEFIASFRIILAGVLALAVILTKQWRRPSAEEFKWLALSGLGVVLGFPFLLNMALSSLAAAEMGVMLAGLPLCTAVIASVLMNERHRLRFWLFSMLGALALACFFCKGIDGLTWSVPAVLLLISVIVSASFGYACGAKAAQTLGGWETICWTLLIYLPVSIVLFAYFSIRELEQISVNDYSPFLGSCAALIYLGAISQWFGFKFWYGAMAKFGAGKIAQLQLLMPFCTLFLAVIVLGEVVALDEIAFAMLISILVLLSIKSK